MLIKRPADIRSSEITDQKLYRNRREFIRAAGLAAARRPGPACSGRRRDAVGGRAGAAWPEARERQTQPVQRHQTRSRTPGSRSPPTTTTTSSAPTRTIRRSTRKSFKTEPWTVAGRRRVRQARRRTRSKTSSRVQTLEERIYRHALRRGVVDGHSVGRLPAGELDQAGRADRQSEVRRVLHAVRLRRRCPACGRRCCAGRTSKGCAWTRRCTR